MAVTLCTSGQVFLVAGKGFSTDFFGGSSAPSGYSTQTEAITDLINWGESFVNDKAAIPGVDLITAFSGLSANKKTLFTEAAACHAALHVTKYDVSGYKSEAEAQLIMNANWARRDEIIKLLNEGNTTDFIRDI